MPKDKSIAVLIPCLNEEVALPRVITEFQSSLPDAQIYVYDNGSTDKTAEIARKMGANVRTVRLRGKGHAVTQAFSDLSEDYIVLVDGDATYDAFAAPKLLSLAVDEHLDMVTGVRKAIEIQKAYRPGHLLGNKVFTWLIVRFFPGHSHTDILSGYRVLSRRYYKSFPMVPPSFEIETYLTIHALNLCMPTGEQETKYSERPSGSNSKLRTYHDGIHILLAILRMICRERPFFISFWISVLVGGMGCALGGTVISEYINTHMILKIPTAILAVSMVLFASITMVCGVLLHYLAAGRRNVLRLYYMNNL